MQTGLRIGVIGLGKMGGGIVRRVSRQGVSCVVYDRDDSLAASLQSANVVAVDSLDALVDQLDSASRRVVWVMVPAGSATKDAVLACGEILGKTNPDDGSGGHTPDIIVDGGNSFYKDTRELAATLNALGVALVDAGTSGGLWGEKNGYCLTVGGATDDIAYLKDVFEKLAAGSASDGMGFIHCGPAGAGHFVKMIQNGIEYGMMQSLAEGFNILNRADLAAPEFELDLAGIAAAWRHGSVVSSWLLELLAGVLDKDPTLRGFEGIVPDSGTGRWTIETAIETATPASVLAAALMQRFDSRLSTSYGNQVLSALRAAFGGHTETQLFRPGSE